MVAIFLAICCLIILTIDQLRNHDPTRYEIVIVGAGFGGIGMAIRLKRAGWHDFVVIEKADKVGGTWRDNTYPGCACDIPSPLYSLSFAPSTSWSRRYPTQMEIFEYLEECVDRFGLQPHLRLRVTLREAVFESTAGARGGGGAVPQKVS